MIEEATSAGLKLRVATASGKFYYSLVNLVDSTGEAAVATFAAVNNGINNVPINVPVLLSAATTTTTPSSWVLTPPAGSAAILTDPGTKNPHTPDVPGQYTAI
jgi:hypothetical protein